MDTFYLVFDAGTGAGRCAVVDQSGRMIQSAYQEWGYEKDPTYPAATHFDAEAFITILGMLAKETIKKADITNGEIQAVTVTSLREGVIFVDSNGNELYAGSNFDDRAEEEGTSLEEASGREIYFTSGTYPPVYGYAARVQWFHKNQPEVYENIHKILTFGDWIIWKLCGEFVAEASLASSSGVFDVKDRKWSRQLCNQLNLNTSWLPSIFSPGEVVGSLSRKVALELGVNPGTAVVLAGGDTQCAMMGMGLVEPNQTGCVAGTTSPVQMLTSEPIFDNLMHTWTNCYLVPYLWCLESNAIVTGLSLRWFRDSFFPGSGYDQMNDIARETPIGSRGLLAYLGAEVMDMTKYKGSWTGGFLFQVPPSEIGIGEFLRASWESIAYAVRANLEQIARITGKEIKELYICGGQTESLFGMQILTDVLGIPLFIQKSQSSILGAGACAAYGNNDYASLTEAAQQMTHEKKILEPDKRNHAFYEDQYPIWIAHYEKIRELSV